MKILEQQIDGIWYRSSLEARWAIFFKEARITFDYEPEGFVVGRRPYRPDFLLRDCGTWAEVKGDPDRLDQELMQAAAAELPRMGARRENGPRLLILGPIPELPAEEGDWAWLGLSPGYPQPVPAEEASWDVQRYGFGSYHKNSRPWWLEACPERDGWSPDYGWTGASDAQDVQDWLLTPAFYPREYQDPQVRRAYFYARAYRFGR